MIPFCVEEGGRFGEGCGRLIDLFSVSLGSLTSDKLAFKTFALRRLHITNQRGVARVVNALKAIPADPHIVVTPTTYELAPPPPLPKTRARAPTPCAFRPDWATSRGDLAAATGQNSRKSPGVP